MAAIADASPITQPWMADAVARIAGDRDLRAARRRASRLDCPTRAFLPAVADPRLRR